MRKFFQALALVSFVWVAAGSVAKATVTYVVWNIDATFQDDASQFLHGTLTYAKDDVDPSQNTFVDWFLNTANATYSSDPENPRAGGDFESGGIVLDGPASVDIVSTDGTASLFLNFDETFDNAGSGYFGIIPDGTSYESVLPSGLSEATNFIVAEGGATIDVPEPASLALLGTGLLLLGSRLRRRSEG